MDRRKYPKCIDCRRSVMYQFYGNFAEHCYLHATDEEIWARNQAYTRKIQEALVQADQEFGEHLGPEHYRIEPGD